jgi:hypothetical protein
LSLPFASKHGFQIRNRGRLFEFEKEEDIIALLEGLGFERPHIYQPTSVLMTGWFNAYAAYGKHVYGVWRRTITVSDGIRNTAEHFIFEVWEMED